MSIQTQNDLLSWAIVFVFIALPVLCFVVMIADWLLAGLTVVAKRLLDAKVRRDYRK